MLRCWEDYFTVIIIIIIISLAVMYQFLSTLGLLGELIQTASCPDGDREGYNRLGMLAFFWAWGL